MVSVEELKVWKFFRVFSDNDLDEIRIFTEQKRFQRGDFIYRRGERAEKFYLLTEGTVSLREFRPDDDWGIAFESRGPGEIFGAAAFMPSREYTLNCVCLEDSEVLEVDMVGRDAPAGLDDLIQVNPLVGYILMKEVATIYFDRYRQCKHHLYEMVKAPTLITALPG